MINKSPLTYSEVYSGLEVVDSAGFDGKIINADDVHNVQVALGNGGFGIYCLDENCDLYDPLYKID